LATLKKLSNPVVDGQPARPDGDQGNRHGCPGQVKVCPSIRHDELDHGRHAEQAQRAQARGKAQNEQDGQDDFGRAAGEREQMGGRQVMDLSEDVQLEFLLEQEVCDR